MLLLLTPLAIAYQLSHPNIGEPFPSADGKKLLYEMEVAGHQELFVMDSDGKNSVQITHDGTGHESPAWSPDGKKIAYVSDRNGHEVIYVMNSDGTGDERITSETADNIHPDWSPDGKRLLYCNDDDEKPPKKNESNIFEIDLATKKVKTLVTGGTNTYASYAPDGKHLVYRHMIGDMNSEVYVANADGSGQKNISNHQAFDGWPTWSPDGKRIAFSSNRNSSYQIHVMNADGSDVKLVANTEGRATEPRWSPDGKMIYFSLCHNLDFGFDCETEIAKLTT